MALEDLTWGNGTKLIFHIADAPQHGKHFNTDKKGDDFLNDENDKYGKDLIQLIKKCSERNIKITGISINNVCSFKVFNEEYEKVDGPKYEIIRSRNEVVETNKYWPCWSLAALLDVLPFPQLSKDKLGSGKVGWMVSVYPDNCRYDSCWHDNPIDACVDMICWLHENNLL